MHTAVDVKRAAEAAATYFVSVMSVHDVRLEEIELSQDEQFWFVTLSGLIPVAKDVPADAPATFGTLAQMLKGPYERVYKVFAVDADTGVVRSMKIRKV
jgi:hypothetical protein